MKKKTVLFIVAGIMMLTGCSVKDVTSGKTSGSTDEIVTASNSAGEGTALGIANAGNQSGSAKGYTIKEPEDKQYTCQEITITLPENWVGNCIMEEHEADFSIYQKASYEKDDTSGYICGFFRTQEPVEYDHGKTMIAYTEDGMLYYLVQPSDVPCDMDDEKIAGEYIRMCQQVPQVKNSMQIEASGVHANADEYLLSTSSILMLDPAMLEGLPDNTLWIARNEIYARHGRQFSNEYLQQYFNRCTWYEGKIPPQEFQESALNQIERENLQLLAAAEEEYDRQHPYPQMYQASETVSKDLNGDGVADKINYQAIPQENGEILCMITVNGDTFIANKLSDSVSDIKMTNPMADCFYIADILESDGILEIAVLDEGPSEDPITYFFQYDLFGTHIIRKSARVF